MQDKKIKNAIEEIKSIKMTDEEKSIMLKNILNTQFSQKTEKPVKSPYLKFYFLNFKSTHLLRFAIIFGFVIIGAGGVTAASHNSLPGSTLYAIKVKIVEPINGAFMLSPEKQAKYEINLATERLVEAQALLSQGNLDEKKEKQLDVLLSAHTEAFNESLNKIRKNNPEKEDTEFVTNFQAEMNARSRVIDLIKENNKENSSEFTKKARDNAAKIRDSKKNINKNHTPEEYKKRKDRVKSLVEKASIEINQTDSTNTPTSKIQERIVEDKRNTLSQAKELLKQAEEEDQKGESQNAYSSLLDSESLIKEVDVLFKTELELKRGKLGL